MLFRSGQDLEGAFDTHDLDEAAQRAGTDRGALLQEMSRLLPSFVDRATPGGTMPNSEADLGKLGLGGVLNDTLGEEQAPPIRR